MSTHLGLLQVECDAPPYTVVRACTRLGLKTPEDVRWIRLSNLRQRRGALTPFFGPGYWAALFGGQGAPTLACSCGCHLPTLETCSFLFATGRSETYHLGQCDRCRTIFWEPEEGATSQPG
jgi:hypothetical protein